MNQQDQQEYLAKKSTLGLRLVNIITQRAKKALTENAKVNENGDVEHLELENVFYYLWEDEKFGDEVLEVIRELLPRLKDQVTCEKRQAWSDERERRRTDLQEYQLEKSKQDN